MINTFCNFIYTFLSMEPKKLAKDERHKKLYVFKMFSCDQVRPIVKNRRKIPFPRSGHRIVCDTKNLYSFGGYNPLIQTEEDTRYEDDEVAVQSFPLFQELWKFNIAAKQWKRFSARETLPRELASNAVLRAGHYLMVYGGTGAPFGDRCSNQLYVCSLKDENGTMHEILTTGKLPLPQYGQALIYYNDYMYTIGGTTGFTYTCDIHRLNMKTHVWEDVYICQGDKEYEPEGRYRHEVAFNGSEVYILGGGTSEVVYDFSRIPVFNLNTRRWSQAITFPDSKRDVCTIPAARRCHGAIQIENEEGIQIFISGGFNGEIAFDDLWKLSLKNMQWTFIDTCKLPYPTYFHSMAVTPEGKMYIFGGISINGDLRRSNSIHSTWLCIPKLSEICWEALLHYNPKLVNNSKERLLNIGLPRHFINRI